MKHVTAPAPASPSRPPLRVGQVVRVLFCPASAPGAFVGLMRGDVVEVLSLDRPRQALVRLEGGGLRVLELEADEWEIVPEGGVS